MIRRAKCDLKLKAIVKKYKTSPEDRFYYPFEITNTLRHPPKKVEYSNFFVGFKKKIVSAVRRGICVIAILNLVKCGENFNSFSCLFHFYYLFFFFNSQIITRPAAETPPLWNKISAWFTQHRRGATQMIQIAALAPEFEKKNFVNYPEFLGSYVMTIWAENWTVLLRPRSRNLENLPKRVGLWRVGEKLPNVGHAVSIAAFLNAIFHTCPYGQKLSVLLKNRESYKRIPQMGNYMGVNGVLVERNVNRLCQTDIRIHLRDKSFCSWDPFEGEKWR